MLVSICVITFNRPQGLARLLTGLNQLTFQNMATPDIEVVVVDNDTKGVAQGVCDNFQADFKWSLKTGVEPQRGISYARNKVIDLASKQADFIAIIDDDEVPCVDWLEQLLLAQNKYAVDVVTGPVVAEFPEDIDVPNWIIRGNFFNQPRYTTGEIRPVAFTNNVLIKGEIIRNLDYVFDNRFALTGGEDSEFFHRLTDLGYKIAWSDEAIVEELVSPHRMNLLWILKTNYRCWATHSLLEHDSASSFNSLLLKIMRLIKGLILIVLGFLKLLPGLFIGKYMLAIALLSISRGVGTFSGLFKFSNYQLYQSAAEIVE